MQWNNLTLNAQAQQEGAQVNLAERPLVSDPTATTPQSVLIGGGRHRRRYSIEGWATMTDYAALKADYESLTARTFIADDVTMTALIESLDRDRRLGSDKAWLRMVVVEK